MGFQDYVSEVEAANICSVGSATLRRFAEAGYLHIESDSDGLQLFSRAELVKLFQLDESQVALTPRLHQQVEVQRPHDTAWTASTVDRGVQFKSPTPSALFDASFDTSSDTSARDDLTRSSASATVEQTLSASTPSQPIILDQPIESLQASASFQIDPASQPSAFADGTNSELLRLQHLVSLYEKLLDYKDGEVKNAREERDYLRRRLEWHEQQSERNQILLLAEAQSTRQLIAAQIERRSVIRHALEWVGLISPPISQAGAQRAIVSMQPIEPEK